MRWLAACATRWRVPVSRWRSRNCRKLVADILNFRDTPPRSGLITDFNQLSSVPGVNAGIMNTLKQECYLAPYTVKKTEMVGPKVGAELRNKAVLATLYALAGMLAYIAFRFEWIYGLAAVIAVFHDTLITIGLFSIFHEEISMTVIAALLDPGGLLDERHHRDLRPHSREFEDHAAGASGIADEQERQPDPEPDHHERRA